MKFFLGIIFSIASSLAFCQNVKIDFKIENQNSITKYLDDKKVLLKQNSKLNLL